jgi:hypothetical protein
MKPAANEAHSETIRLSEASPFPAGRTREDGPYSGEQFREDWLAPALKKGRVTVLLDHQAGLPVSFLEEGFGGLVRSGFSEAALRELLVVETPRKALERYIPMIWEYIHNMDTAGHGSA